MVEEEIQGKSVNIKMPLELYQFLAKQAEKECRSMAGVVKIAVLKYKELTEKEKK